MSSLFLNNSCAILEAMTNEQKRDMETLRYMLAELLEKQSSATLTSEQRQWTERGIKALRSAVDAIEVQVYA